MRDPTGKCPNCGGPSKDWQGEVVGTAVYFPIRCEECLQADAERDAARRSQELARQNHERRERFAATWKAICPALYQATNANHPAMNQDLLQKVLAWRPSGNGKGIGLTGPTGGCKTRTMSLLLRDLHFSGVQVRWVNAIELSRASSEVFDEDRASEAKNVLRNAAHAKVLFIDDIGKERFTDRAELELYSLIETRVAHLRPILWTSNACGKELREMMSGNRGPAITRRLAEFSYMYFLPYKRAEPIEHLAASSA